jgi:MFS family permease
MPSPTGASRKYVKESKRQGSDMSQDKAARPASAWVVLGVTLAIQAMVSMAVLTVPAMAPAMARQMGVSVSLIGFFVSVIYLGAMASSMCAGSFVLRWGAMRVSQIGLLLCAAGLIVLACTPWPALALPAAVLIGLGYGPITPASSHILVRTTASTGRASLLFSVKQTGVPLGGVMAGALVPPMVLGAGSSAALWSVASACLICACAAEWIRRDLDNDRQPDRRINFSQLWQPISLVIHDGQLRRLAAVSFVFSALQMCLAAYLVTYLNAELGLTLVAAGAALSVSQTGGVVGRILWGWLADRWISPLRMLALLALIMASCAVGTGLLQANVPSVVLMALLALFGASATGWNGVYLAEVARQAPAGAAGIATGGSLAFTFLGVVVGPLVFGLVAGTSGSFRLSYLLIALPVALCAWALLRQRASPPTTG